MSQKLLIITGLSGAGKTQTCKILEDFGYYVVDNIPSELIPKFAEISYNSEYSSKIAIVTDIRSARHSGDIFSCLKELNELNIGYHILFVYAREEILERRYSATRRKHPLAGRGKSTRDAIREEVEMLKPLMDIADYQIDTSDLNLTQLRNRVLDILSIKSSDQISVYCESFGYKYGIPSDSDLVFDVRCLPNPFYVDDLKARTGLEKDVQDYVFSTEESIKFLDKLKDFLSVALPMYEKEGKSQLVISFGCTGGKHRSVTLCEKISEYLKNMGYITETIHRDITKT